MKQKRTYRSGSRDAGAAQTRLHILEAAKKLFQSEGFDRVTIGQIADAAAVSTPTIYAVFKSKRGILQALLDAALPPERFTSLVEEAMREPSGKKRLSVTAELTRQMYDAEKELMDIVRGASMVASEFKELEQERERRRYERQEEYVKLLMMENGLAPGLTLQKARDILWAFTGRDLYRMFVMERGWSSLQYEKWLADLLIQSLLGETR